MTARTMPERLPCILITGTPGVGKTTLCERLVEAFSDSVLHHINLATVIQREHLFEEYDHDLNCSIFDEDKVSMRLKELIYLKENQAAFKAFIVDFHSCQFMDKELFDLVVVMRADTAVIYDRLKARDYSEKKISENVEAEIFQVVLDEAREAFLGIGDDEEDDEDEEKSDNAHSPEFLVIENNSMQDLDLNVERVKSALEKLGCNCNS